MTVRLWKTGDCVVGRVTDNMLQSSAGASVACLASILITNLTTTCLLL
jgi:hypothetical protein